jgi:hypothetical protein
MITGGKLNRPKRFAFYGPEGIGKSILASLFPGSLFFDCEEGTNELDVQRFSSAQSWGDVFRFLKFLRSEEAKPFPIIVFDTVDKLQDLSISNICEKSNKGGIEDFGYGKGYTYLAEMLSAFLADLDVIRETTGKHIILLGHSTLKKIELPEESGAFDHYELNLEKKVSPLIKKWVDGLFFINYKITIQENKEGKKKASGGKSRVIYTTHTHFADAKNRWGFPEEIDAGETIEEMKAVVEKYFLPILSLDDFSPTEIRRPEPVPSPAPKPKKPKPEKEPKPNEPQPAKLTPLEAVEGLMRLHKITEEDLNKFLIETKTIPPENSYKDLAEPVLKSMCDRFANVLKALKGGK